MVVDGHDLVLWARGLELRRIIGVILTHVVRGAHSPGLNTACGCDVNDGHVRGIESEQANQDDRVGRDAIADGDLRPYLASPCCDH